MNYCFIGQMGYMKQQQKIFQSGKGSPAEKNGISNLSFGEGS